MKSNEALAALAALASEARLAVFRLLVRRGPEGFTPGELTRRLGVPAPTLSFHLRELVSAGLVTSRREGRNLFYHPELQHMRALMDFLTENCCSLAEAGSAPGCPPQPAVARGSPGAARRRRA